MRSAVIGSFVVDLMARTPHLPEHGETVKGSFFKAGPGGKGSNQAIAAKRAGCDLTFSTKLGQDEFASIAKEAFFKDSIAMDYVFTTDQAATAAALISVDEHTGENEIIVVLGACETYNNEDIFKLDKALNGCEYLLMQLEINTDALEKLVDIAYDKGIKIILNTAPVQQLNPDIYKKLYMVTPNEVEARSLTGIQCSSDEDCSAVARRFFEMGVKAVIITLGKRGVYINDGSREAVVDNYDVEVVDTTGAGDAFNGGLLAGLAKGMSIMEAATYGNVVSNLAVTRMGTAPAMPYAWEIEKFIDENGLKLSMK